MRVAPFAFAQAAEKADLQPILDAACRSHITYEPGYYEKIQCCAHAMLNDAQLYALTDELRKWRDLPALGDNLENTIFKTPDLYGLCLRTVPNLDPMTGEQVLGTPNGPLYFKPCSSC